jgi:predicted metal-binding protein
MSRNPPSSRPRGDPSRQGFQYLEDLASAYWRSETLFTALELGVFQRLGDQCLQPAELARSAGWDAEALERLLAALAELGLLVEHRGGYANAPLAARCLVPGRPDFLGGFLTYRRYLAPHWKRLAQRVARGPTANERPREEDPDDYAQRVAAHVEALDAQARLKAREALPLLEPLLERRPERILDLGGGAGAWCRALLQNRPEARAVLLDLPEVVAAASDLYPRAQDWSGISRAACDLRKPCLRGPGFDLVIFSNLLHAYGRREAGDLVRWAAGLLAPGGTLLIHDYRLEGHPRDPLKGRLYDLHMLLNTYNGRIHSEAALTEMLAAAGLGRLRSFDLESDTSLILAQAGPVGADHLDDLDLLAARALGLGFARAQPISPDDVAVEAWVRLKCRHGCPVYAQRLTCPPHAPDENDMMRILAGFKRALLLESTPPGKEFHHRLLALERQAFLAGFHKALAFGAGPCPLCPECDTSRPCKLPGQARPSLEACGVDVYETAHRAGWSLAPVSDRQGVAKFLGLLLVD